MANANPSQSGEPNKSKKGASSGKPRVRQTKASDFQVEKDRANRPHEVIEESEKHTITQLRSGTVKIVRH